MKRPTPRNPDDHGSGGGAGAAGAPGGRPASAERPPIETIIARKRVDVAKAKTLTPLKTLKQRVAQIRPPRNFFAAVVNERDRARTRIIAEIMRRSPVLGELREDFDAVAIAREYENAGAAAISCVTEEEHYGGHPGYIQQIREAVALPVLRHDFIVDEYQVWESRAAGADAILLIAEILAEGELLDLMILAQKLRMTTLVQVHEVESLLTVRRHIGFPHAGYFLLGINNRDTRTMKADLSHSFRLSEMVEKRHMLVSEAGIETAEDLSRLRQHGINIVLIGEPLLCRPSPGGALREIMRSTPL